MPRRMATPQHHAENVCAVGPEGHADTDLAATAQDHVGDDAVETDHGEDGGEGSKESRECGH
jgi:hypothetical protein